MNNSIEKPADLFKKSVIVAAHPDDEVLWFSSLLADVDDVILCYMGEKSRPHRRLGRQISLSEYPIKNISCLNVEESETFYGVNWKSPIITKYGMEIADKKYSDKTYKENYYQLREKLQGALTGRCNVFTHNPWGEYGHPDHVQIYRVIKELQESMDFTVWFPNYVSNKSFTLMMDYMDQLDLEYVTLKTNRILANTIKDIYLKNNCWTWYDNWEWLHEESFIRDEIVEKKTDEYGFVPMNVIQVWLPSESKSKFQHKDHLISRIFDSRIVNKIKAKSIQYCRGVYS